MTDSGVFWHIV